MDEMDAMDSIEDILEIGFVIDEWNEEDDDDDEEPHKVDSIQEFIASNKSLRLKENIPEEERDVLRLQIKLDDGTTSDVSTCFKDSRNIWRYNCNPCNIRGKQWDFFYKHIKSKNHINLVNLLKPVHSSIDISVVEKNDLSSEKKKTMAFVLENKEKTTKINESIKKGETKKTENVKITELKKPNDVQKANELTKTGDVQVTTELKKPDRAQKIGVSNMTDKEKKTGEFKKTDELKITVDLNKTDKIKNTDKSKSTDEVKKMDKSETIDEMKKTDEIKNMDKLKSTVEVKKETIDEMKKTDEIKKMDISETIYEMKKTDEIKNMDKLKSTVEVKKETIDEMKKTDEIKKMDKSETIDDMKKTDEIKNMDKLKSTVDLNKTDKIKNTDKSESTDEVKKMDKSETIDEMKKTDEIKNMDKLKSTVELKKETIDEMKKTDEIKKMDKSETIDEMKKTDEIKNMDKLKSTVEVKKETIDEMKKTDEIKKMDKSETIDEMKKTDEIKNMDKSETLDEMKKTDEIKNMDKLKSTDGIKKTDELKITDEVKKTDKSKTTNDIKKTDELEKMNQVGKTDVSKEVDKSNQKEPKKVDEWKKESGNKKKIVCKIQSKLDNYFQKPLIGLEYLLEIISNRPPTYYCLLCDKKGDDSRFIHHFSKQKHYTQYLTLFFHTAADKLNLYYKIGKNHDLFNCLTEHVVGRIEHVLGRLEPTQIKKDTFLYNKFTILDKIEKGKHFRESSEQNFVQCVNMTHFEKDKCAVGWKGKLKSKGTASPQQLRNFSGDGISSNNAIPGRVSQHMSPHHKQSDTRCVYYKHSPTDSERSKNPECFTLQENQGNNLEPKAIFDRFEEERRFYKFTSLNPDTHLWQNYKERVQLIEDNLSKEIRYYHDMPRTHPLYDKEWKEYWSKRNEKPTETADWLEFWEKQLKGWFDEKLEMEKAQLRVQLEYLHTTGNKDEDDKPCVETKSVHDGSSRPSTRLSVIPILRRLSTLKHILGPLVSKVDNLLFSALTLEDLSENSADEILLVKDNCAILEEIKESLERYILSEFVDKNTLPVTESAILNIMDLLRTVSKRKHDGRKSPYTKQVFIRNDTSTVYKVSELNLCVEKLEILSHLTFSQRTTIVQEIAAELFLRGLTEITEDQLLQLNKILMCRDNSPGIQSSSSTLLGALNMIFGNDQSAKKAKKSRSSSISLSPDTKGSKEKSPLKLRRRYRMRHRSRSQSRNRMKLRSHSRSPTHEKKIGRVPRTKAAGISPTSGTQQPDFLSAPYKFWVRSDVEVGTTVGMIKVNEMANMNQINFNLLHGYYKGVPFAIEQNSGTITVVDQVTKYEQMLFDFEVVVTDQHGLMLKTTVTIQVEHPGLANVGPVPMIMQQSIPVHSSGETGNTAGQTFQHQSLFPIPVCTRVDRKEKFKQDRQQCITTTENSVFHTTQNNNLALGNIHLTQNTNQRYVAPQNSAPPPAPAPGGWNSTQHIPQVQTISTISNITRSKVPSYYRIENAGMKSTSSGNQQSNWNVVGSNLKVVQINEEDNFPVSDNYYPTPLKPNVNNSLRTIQLLDGQSQEDGNSKITQESNIAHTSSEDMGGEIYDADTSEKGGLDTGYDVEEIRFCRRLTLEHGSPALKKFKMRKECLESKLIKDMKYYRDNPHKHINYQNEMDLFWSKRAHPSTIENRWDIMKNEFAPYWDKLLKELYRDKFKTEKSKIRQEFVHIYFDKKIEKPDQQHQDRISYRPRSPPQRFDKGKIKHSPYRELHKRSCSPSIKTNTIKKTKLLSEKTSNNSRYSSEKNRMEDNRKHSKDKAHIVPVLRYISVLEKNLDSLGPKVLNLLSEALLIEKSKDNADIESFIVKNYVLLDTIKEKLLGLLEANIIEKSLINVAENAIEKVDSLLSRVKKIPIPEKVASNINKTPTDSLTSNDGKQHILKITEIANFIENLDKLSHLTGLQRATISQAVGTSLIYQNILEITKDDTMVLVQATLNKLNYPLNDYSYSKSIKQSSFYDNSDVQNFKQQSDSDISHRDLFNIPFQEESFRKLTKQSSSFDRNRGNFQQLTNYNQRDRQIPSRDSLFNLPSKEDSFREGNQDYNKLVRKNPGRNPLFPAYVTLKEDSIEQNSLNPINLNNKPSGNSNQQSTRNSTFNVTQTSSLSQPSTDNISHHFTSQQGHQFSSLPQSHHTFNYNQSNNHH